MSRAEIKEVRCFRIEILLLLAAVLVFCLPFTGKAYHVDSAYFVGFSRETRSQTVHANFARYTFPGYVFGQPMTLSKSFFHPPFLVHLLRGFRSVVPQASEVHYHLLMLCFTFISVLFCYLVARMYTSHAFWVALGLLCTPGFLLNAHNVMSDVPALALILGGIYYFLRSWDSQSPWNAPASVLFFFCGSMIRYTTFWIIPALLAFGWFSSGWKGIRTVALRLLLPWGVAILVLLGSLWPLGLEPIFGFHAEWLKYLWAFRNITEDRAEILASLIISLGGATIFPVFLIVFHKPTIRRWIGLLVAAGGIVLACGLLRQELCAHTLLNRVLLMVCLLAGVGALFLPFSDWRDPKKGFLLWWILSYAFLAIMLLPFGAVRYWLPVIPPVLLLWVLRFDADRAKKLLRPAVMLTALVGLLVAAADYHLANSCRQFVDNIVKRGFLNKQSECWYIGEWGFRYYMHVAGASYLAKDKEPEPGDFVFRSDLACPWRLSEENEMRLMEIQRFDLESDSPIRTMSHKALSGFYSHAWGFLPYAFSRGPVESVTLYVVGEPAAGRE